MERNITQLIEHLKNYAAACGMTLGELLDWISEKPEERAIPWEVEEND